jgi:hypothetical protein
MQPSSWRTCASFSLLDRWKKYRFWMPIDLTWLAKKVKSYATLYATYPTSVD